MVSTASRRTFLMGVTAGLAAAGLPRPARAASTKILIMGGSQIAGALGLYLGNELSEMGYAVHRRGKSSTGLARPDFFDWEAEAKKQFEEFQPQATICLFGGNDGQGLHMGKKAEPQWIRYHEEGWTEEYARRVDAFADAVTPGGELILWLGMPVIRQTKLRTRVQHMNEIFKGKMDARDNGHYIETWSALTNDKGEYTDHLVLGGKKVRVRANDGVHLTVKGAHHMVDHIAPAVQGIVG